MMVLKRTLRRASLEFGRLPVRLRGDHRVNDGGRGVLGFVDVGSAGALPPPWDNHAYLIRRLLKFEPLNVAQTDPHVTSLDVAVWERDEERDFYVSVTPHGSSLFQQNTGYVQENFEELRRRGPAELADSWFERSALARVERVRCRALDGILSEIGESFEFLKIDAQGAEHQILKGAEGFLLEQCHGLHLELFTVPLYKDISLMPEVSDWLDERGFSLVHKAPAHGTFDSQHDCLFLKRGNSAAHAAIKRAYNLR